MKKLILLSLILLSVAISLSANQAWTQYYFRFELLNKAELQRISDTVSIDNIRGNWVYAYANDWEWAQFQKLGYKAQILPNPGDMYEHTMTSSTSRLRDWDSYPTYEAYVTMMYQFASSYPNLCQIIDAGTTVNGRKLLFARISDNVNQDEIEPKVMYTATMHGDETAGYVLMLRLIDTLLSQYGSDTRITNLVNNLEIWINPLANPDGTYYGGNSSVTGSRRANAGGFDLNRNFPSPTGQQYTVGGVVQTRQIETTHMMNLADTYGFALAANFHGGEQVVNYPWDTWTALHPDNTWYIGISRAYATSAQNNSPSGYMTSYNNGITNGAAWYVITGGRQDWMNYSGNSREVTIELSTVKTLPANQLNSYWNYNYDALLGYLESAYYGIHGLVTDPFGNPLNAEITVVSHDSDYTKIRSNQSDGSFYRFLSPGTYSLQISANGFPTRTIDNVTVAANQKTELNVMLGDPVHYQNLALSAGWNLISFNVELSTADVQSVFGSVMDDLIQVKSVSNSYSPLVSNWFNTLDTIESTSAYWVNMSTARTLNIQGNLMDPAQNQIHLNRGWNLVSYLPDTSLSIQNALSSINQNLLEVRSINDYWLPNGSRNSLDQMTPGKGYWIRVDQDCILTYPSR